VPYGNAESALPDMSRARRGPTLNTVATKQPATPSYRPEWAVSRPVPAVWWWAAVGVVALAIEAYIWVKWLTGPNFARVPTGPDQPPAWMRSALTGIQVLVLVADIAFAYWFVIRPWRRERRVPLDGRLALTFFLTCATDPVSNGLQGWLSYNSWMPNWGAPAVELPGWLSPHGPGIAPAMTMPLIPAAYFLMPLIGMVATAILKLARRRFPGMRAPGLLLMGFAGMIAFDVVLEGFVLLPLGMYSYGGGVIPVLFGGHYFQLPLPALLHAAVLWTAVGALRFFVDDTGLTIVERGATAIGARPWKRSAARMLALVGVSHVMVLGLFHLPAMLWATHASPYPQDVKERSYFMNQCGPRIDRACPSANVPLTRPGSGYVNWNGKYVSPSP
jgi:Spirocyclase AveC-like